MDILESVQPQTPEETLAQPQAGQPEPAAGIKVKYNGEEREISLDEAVTLSQKGMNYDKLQQRLAEREEENKRLKQSKEFEDEVASFFGKPTEEARQLIKQQLQESAISEIAKTRGVPIDVARDLYQKDRELQTVKPRLQQIETQQATEQAKEQRAADMKAELDSLLDSGVSVEDLKNMPKAFHDAWEKGVSLKDLHTEYARLVKTKQEETAMAEAQKINDENAASAPTPIGGAPDQQGELTKESIDRMTPEELERNHDKVWAFYIKQR